MNTKEYQEQYFKYMYINYPILSYNYILLIISEKYKVSYYSYPLKKNKATIIRYFNRINKT